MAVRKLKESKTLKNYEIADMLVANGFGNEEEGYLDYFLPDNPKYVASVNLDDMGSYIDDLDEGEHISLPYANNADRKILRTEEDVEEFLSFIQELNYSDMFESKTRKTRKRITENTDEHYTEIDELIDYVEYVCNKCGINVQNKIYDANTTFGEVSFNFYYGDRYDKSKFITHVTLTWDFEDERSKPFFLSWDGGGFTRKFDNMQGVRKYMEFIVKGF